MWPRLTYDASGSFYECFTALLMSTGEARALADTRGFAFFDAAGLRNYQYLSTVAFT